MKENVIPFLMRIALWKRTESDERKCICWFLNVFNLPTRETSRKVQKLCTGYAKFRFFHFQLIGVFFKVNLMQDNANLSSKSHTAFLICPFLRVLNLLSHKNLNYLHSNCMKINKLVRFGFSKFWVKLRPVFLITSVYFFQTA